MKLKVDYEGNTYAILVSPDPVEGREWYGNNFESLQAARLKYSTGKSFRIHHHILNPRIIKQTQESFIVIKGKIAVDIYAVEPNESYTGPLFLKTLEAGPGQAVLIYRGAHGVRVLEDAVFYEIKSGQFTCQSEDKKFME